MGVKYQVVTKTGAKILMDDICFGRMNYLPFSQGEVESYSVGGNGFNSNDSIRSIQGLGNPGRNGLRSCDMRQINFIYKSNHCFPGHWSDPQMRRVRRNANWSDIVDKNMATAFRELIADLPVFQDIVKVKPKVHQISVLVEGVPADKVMSALFLFRNLSNYEYSRKYLHMRSLGYRPRYCAIMCSLWQERQNSDYSDGDCVGYYRVGEASWICPQSSGVQTILNWLNQSETSYEWYQEGWTSQVKGYKRDSVLKREEVVFDETSTSLVNDWGEMRRENGPLYYRILCRSLCVPNDEPMPLIEKNQHTNVMRLTADTVPFHDLLSEWDSFLIGRGAQLTL